MLWTWSDMTCEQWGCLSTVQWGDWSLVAGPQGGRPDAIDLDRLSHGDPGEWRSLVQREYDRLVVHAATIVHNSHDAADVVQTAFMRLWLARENLRGVRDIARYVRTATRNQALNHLRTTRRIGEAILPGARLDDLPCHAAAEPLRRMVAAERANGLERTLARLSSCQRRVFDEIVLDPTASSREIAGKLGCSHSNVLALVGRIREVVPRALMRRLD